MDQQTPTKSSKKDGSNEKFQFSETRNLFTNLYSKFTGTQNEEANQIGRKSIPSKSPFKDFIRRKISGDDGEIFGESDLQNTD